jgi:hypothetical protein
MELEAEPKELTVRTYVLTAAAARAWESIERAASSARGSFFWIGGRTKVGKTHFLNYVLSLERIAGGRSLDDERRLAIALSVAAGATAVQLEGILLEQVARELGGDKRAAAVWRALGNAGGLRVALSEAHRLGVRRLTIAVDLGDFDPAALFDCFRRFAQIIASNRAPVTTMLVAGRGPAPDWAAGLDVAPHSGQEAMLAAVARAREFLPRARQFLHGFYAGTQGETEQAFPFHSETLRALLALAPSDCAVGDLARLARDALDPSEGSRNMALRRLLLPSDLTASAPLSRRIETLLGEAGRNALRTSYAAASSLSRDDGELPRQIVDSLLLAHFEGRELELGQLCARLPKATDQTRLQVRKMLERLAQTAGGAIRFDGRSARFNPRLPHAREMAAFATALPVLRRLDPSLPCPRDADDLELILGRLGNTVAQALELARDVGEKLSAFAFTQRAAIAPQYAQGLDEFISLLSQGPAALVDTAADANRAQQLAKVFDDFRLLTGAAALVPQMSAMSRYLEETGLLDSGQAPFPDATGTAVAPDTQEQLMSEQADWLARLRMQARLSAAELNFRLLFANRGAFEAVQARFRKFRAEYAQCYRVAHEKWRTEMRRLQQLARNASALLEVLKRLNSISFLGPPDGIHLAAELAACASQVVLCDRPSSSTLEHEHDARCTRCGYMLGAQSPQVAHSLEAIERAVKARLARLSHNAIKRLISEHDDRDRLEGFLKIVQAAQTDALARVLDDELTEYLRRLLDDESKPKRASGGSALSATTKQAPLFRARQRAHPVHQRIAALDRPPQKRPPRSK